VLVDAGADVNAQAAREYGGSTPLDMARAGRHMRCVEVLKQAGAVTDDDLSD